MSSFSALMSFSSPSLLSRAPAMSYAEASAKARPQQCAPLSASTVENRAHCALSFSASIMCSAPRIHVASSPSISSAVASPLMGYRNTSTPVLSSSVVICARQSYPAILARVCMPSRITSSYSAASLNSHFQRYSSSLSAFHAQPSRCSLSPYT